MVEPLDRVFVAAPLPDQPRLALAALLGSVSVPGRVVPPENWHLTLRFLGRIDRVTYERVVAGIDESELGRRFVLGLAGIGAFPRPKKATVTWVGVSRGMERLAELAVIADDAATGAGLEPEERPFRPHLTLSRIRPPEDVTTLVEEGTDIAVAWRCETIVVYRSDLGRGGARYEPLETFPLSR